MGVIMTGYIINVFTLLVALCRMKKFLIKTGSAGVCNQPYGVIGSCRQRTTMWTYHKYHQKCLPYWGCKEGNGNKFNSKAECEKKCVAVSHEGQESFGSACKLGMTDHFPYYLAKVFKDPKRYLEGPEAKVKTKQKHFIIVGGGIAGLTSAYLLLQAGHKVTLLESSQRIGGRILTHYGEGYYGDMGAMRFPSHHYLFHSVVDHLKVPVTRFTHDFNSPESYVYFNGKYYGVDELALRNESLPFDEEKLMELYKLFHVETPPRDRDGKLRPLLSLFHEINKDTSADDMCKNDRTYAVFVREGLEKRGADPNLMNIWAAVWGVRPLYGHSMQEFLIDSVQKVMPLEKERYHHHVEIVNGAAVLPETIFKKIKKHKNFSYKFGSKVVKVAESNKIVSVTAEESQPYGGSIRGRTISGDYAILTPTARSVSFMEFDPPLPFFKKMSVDQLNYFGSVKIILKFSRPWWASKNKLPIIKYGGMGTLNGASAHSDDILRATYYPSNDLHGPSLLASYTWDHDSEVFVAMTDEQCIEAALKHLEERHGSVVRETYQTGAVKKWQEDNHAYGGFVLQNAFQRHDLMEHLMASHGRVLFSAEYANKLFNGWVEAALESAVRNLVKLWPTQYQKRHGKAEEQFFSPEPGQDYSSGMVSPESISNKLFGRELPLPY